MNKLRQLQQGMQSFILEKNDSISDVVVKPDDMSATDRLHVYRNAYYIRLTDILAKDYEIFRQFIGEKTFANMAHDYLNTHPSHDFSVRAVGRNLPKFLESFSDFNPVYSELARFEWAFSEALYAKDAEELAWDDLAQLKTEDWENLTLQFHPSMQLIPSQHNIAELWEAVNDEQEWEIQTYEKPIINLIWRRDYLAFYYTANLEETILVQAIKEGKNFAELCELMLVYYDDEEAVSMTVATLQRWVDEGFFSLQQLGLY